MENEIRFLSFFEFKERYNIKTNFPSFCGVISAIKPYVTTFNDIPAVIVKFQIQI